MGSDSVDTFLERLRNVCENHGDCDGPEREERIRNETKHAVAVASEFGILKEVGHSWEEFRNLCEGANIGTEHMVELDPSSGLVGKTTIPHGFGVIPELRKLPFVSAKPDSDSSGEREQIEFFDATPLEYLSRWKASNDIFGDDVQLVSVVRWRDGLVSFGITQPQYHGVPADARDIEKFFVDAGWTRLNDPSGHLVFFNYAFEIMAIDAEKRNCYINAGGLQPFDVILSRPSEDMDRFLNIFPR